MKTTVLGTLLLAQASAFAAAPVRIDFEGTTTSVAGLRSDVAVSDFYAGGSSKVPGSSTPVAFGATPGIGVVFSSSALVTETSAGGNGGSSSVFGTTRNLILENGSVLANSAALGNGIGYADTTGVLTLTFAAGFNDGLSFFFNAGSDITVSILKQDGSLLTSNDFTFSSTVLCSGGETRCSWNAASLAFSGTAFGVQFSGAPGDFALDNLTLGQLDPLGSLLTGPSTGGGGTTGGGGGGTTGGGGGGSTGGGGVPVVPAVVTPIPEPSTYALMGLGLGLLAWTARRRRASGR